MQSLDIQGFSYEERQGLLPSLTSAFADCGGWILNRRTLSPTTVEFRVEIQLRAVIDLYASIISSGLELTRAGHLGFTHLCTCRKNLTTPADLGQIITIRRVQASWKTRPSSLSFSPQESAPDHPP